MITETFDPSTEAVINPLDIVSPVAGFPRVAVSCFSGVTFARLVEDLDAAPISEAVSGDANGSYPIYRAQWQGREFALLLSRVGAAGLAGNLEDIFAFGAEAVVLFGTCGVLDRSIADCGVILPDVAVRDEGVSYHYAPAADEIEVNVGTLDLAKAVLDGIGVTYTVGKVWTTDGFYRETRALVERRKSEGCICVDMECAAAAAIAAFRHKRVLQFFYAGDNLDAEAWEPRSLANESNLAEKDRIAYLAMTLAAAL